MKSALSSKEILNRGATIGGDPKPNRVLVQSRKRRSTGALQNAKHEMCAEVAATFWSAALLRRFRECRSTAAVWAGLLRFRPADHTAGDTSTGVARWLSLQIVRFRVDDDRAANRRFRIVREGNLMIDVIELRVAGSVCFYVAHVALVPGGCIWPGVRLVGGIEMGAGGTGIGCAAIAEFVYVKAVLTRRQARDLRVDLHAIGGWRECDGAGDLIA
jgi:hypothetical protein